MSSNESTFNTNTTCHRIHLSMAYEPEKHHRRSIRLKGYDYTQPGAYYITLCTKARQCLFDDVVNGEM